MGFVNGGVFSLNPRGLVMENFWFGLGVFLVYFLFFPYPPFLLLACILASFLVFLPMIPHPSFQHPNPRHIIWFSSWLSFC